MKLTEKEFLDKMAARVAGTTCRHRQAEIARDILREGGLEFAPEPKLPERLACLNGCAMADGFIALQEVRRGDAPFDPHAVLQAAVDRFNAYPGLREAAFQVLERAQNLVAKTYAGTVATPPWLHLRDSLSFLEDELAEGPK